MPRTNLPACLTARVCRSARPCPSTRGVNFGAITSGPTTGDFILVNAAGQTSDIPVYAVAEMAAKLLVSPTTAQFVATLSATSSPVRFRVANGGDGASGPLDVALSGADVALFALVSNGCAGPLTPLAFCSVAVISNPQAADGGATLATTRTATLTVTDTGESASVASAELTGNLVGP